MRSEIYGIYHYTQHSSSANLPLGRLYMQNITWRCVVAVRLCLCSGDTLNSRNKNLDNAPPHLYMFSVVVCVDAAKRIRGRSTCVLFPHTYIVVHIFLTTSSILRSHISPLLPETSSSIKSGYGQENCKRIQYDYDVLCFTLVSYFVREMSAEVMVMAPFHLHFWLRHQSG